MTIDYKSNTTATDSHDAATETIRVSFQPSDFQEKLLGFLPIPSAILSVLGSSVIIYMIFKAKQQQQGKLTPYLRLLFAMSVYDIVYSLNSSVAAFLRPQDTSLRMLSVGNKTTCNVVGFLNQISHATMIYQGMLGFYFLLTVRYGISNSYIARRFEPWMHIISIGYPLVFGIALEILDGYGEVTMGIGCWIAATENFAIRIISWVSYAIPLILVMISLVLINTTILLHARRQRRLTPHSTKSFTLGTSTRIYSESIVEDDDRDDSSVSTQPEAKYVLTGAKENCSKDVARNDMLDGSLRSATALMNNKDQARRIRLVSSQAILFVISFVVCNAWTGVCALLEDQRESVQDELAMLVRMYPIFVLQAIFSPLQGFFNMMVFIRPKYLKFRHLHKRESRQWVIRRAIFGEEVKPTTRPRGQSDPLQLVLDGNDSNQLPAKAAASDQVLSPSVARLPPDMVSDLTASQGDFDHVMQGMDDERWDDKTSMNKSRNAPLVSQRKRSSLLLQSALDIISENEESVFETLSEMLRSEDDDILFSPPRTLDRRWSSGSIQLVAASGADGDDDHERPRKKHELALAIPARLESSFDSSIEEIVSMAPASPDDEIENATSHHSPANNNSGGGESSPDLPIQVPQRRMSPPSIFNI